MFASRPDRHEFNIRQAASYGAKTGLLLTPDGGQEPAVVLRSGGVIQAVLPAADALRLANEIADALSIHRKYATN